MLHTLHCQVAWGVEGEGRGWLVPGGTSFTEGFVSLSHSFFIRERGRM